MTPELWWEEWPDRLELELQELLDAGATVEVDEDLRSHERVLRLHIAYPYEGEELDLIVTFPDLYPRFRFSVTTPAEYARHQNPAAGVLCLLDRPTEAWSKNDTVASVLREQLDLFFASQPGPDGVLPDGVLETVEAEPVSGYYPHEAESVVLVESRWDLAGHGGGTIVIGVESRRSPEAPLLRGAVLQVASHDGTPVATAEPALTALYEHRITGRWQRIVEPPRSGDPAALLQAAAEHDGSIASAAYQPASADGHGPELDVVGVVFQEEVRHRQKGDAWVFVVRARHRTKPVPKGKGGRTTPPSRVTLPPVNVTAQRAGREDLASRIPELHALRSKKVVLVGAGGVGAPSAIEFAKAQLGTLVVVEPERLEPGNAVRYPLGVRLAGWAKVRVVCDFISSNWPYTTVGGTALAIGHVRQAEDRPTDQEILLSHLEDADLIYDAAGEYAVSLLLSDVAKELGIALVVATSTEGAWGGRVAQFLPGEDEPCWSCMQHHIADEPNGAAGQPGSLVPPGDPSGSVEPVGCAHPTFTGAGFDTAEVAINGVRLAASVLSSDTGGGYPGSSWNVGVLRFRAEDGTAIPCASDVHTIRVHERCGACLLRRSG